jgi:hypothetical protein
LKNTKEQNNVAYYMSKNILLCQNVLKPWGKDFLLTATKNEAAKLKVSVKQKLL